MNISRSGYYKWLKNKDILNNYEINRRDLGELIKDIHKRKSSYGYHIINAVIRREIGWNVSDNLETYLQIDISISVCKRNCPF